MRGGKERKKERERKERIQQGQRAVGESEREREKERISLGDIGKIYIPQDRNNQLLTPSRTLATLPPRRRSTDTIILIHTGNEQLSTSSKIDFRELLLMAHLPNYRG